MLQSHFTRELRRLNGSTRAELRQWLFVAGMRFGDTDKWWKEGEARSRPHEGLDLLFFLDDNGGRHLLPPGTIVPPLLAGIEVARSVDFLGETIIITHDHWDEAGRRLHTFYAHLQLEKPARSGRAVAIGDRVGRIAASAHPAPACPPHLHLSLAWVGEAYPIKDFRWEGFNPSELFVPVDPVVLVTGPGIR